MGNIKYLLEEELEAQLEKLQRLEVGSKEYEVTTECISKLMQRLNDAEKLELDAQEKEASRIQDAELRTAEIKEQKKGRITQALTTVAGIVIPVGLTIWGTLTTLKFEEEGTITSSSGKEFTKKLFRK